MGEAAGPWRKLAARAARVQELEFRILGRQTGPRPAIIFRESSLDRIFAPHGLRTTDRIAPSSRIGLLSV